MRQIERGYMKYLFNRNLVNYLVIHQLMLNYNKISEIQTRSFGKAECLTYKLYFLMFFREASRGWTSEAEEWQECQVELRMKRQRREIMYPRVYRSTCLLFAYYKIYRKMENNEFSIFKTNCFWILYELLIRAARPLPICLMLQKEHCKISTSTSASALDLFIHDSRQNCFSIIKLKSYKFTFTSKKKNNYVSFKLLTLH